MVKILASNEQLNNEINLDASYGNHWMPKGHRLITQYLIKCISQSPKLKSINVIYQASAVAKINSNKNILSSKFTYVSIQQYIYIFA